MALAALAVNGAEAGAKDRRKESGSLCALDAAVSPRESCEAATLPPRELAAAAGRVVKGFGEVGGADLVGVREVGDRAAGGEEV